MIYFKLARHATRDVQVVEVWRDSKLLATVCPDEGGHNLRVLSRHIDRVKTTTVLGVTAVEVLCHRELVN